MITLDHREGGVNKMIKRLYHKREGGFNIKKIPFSSLIHIPKATLFDFY
jgi:hypothetical protein